MSDSRYSSIVRWKASRSLRLTGTVTLSACRSLVASYKVLAVQNLANFLDSEKLAGLVLAKAS